MKMRPYFLLVSLLYGVAMMAQPAIDDVSIIQEIDTIWGFGYNGINLFERPMHRIDIAYPTLDPEGNPCTMSGVIAIPSDVLNGEQPCDGMVLYNHYTQLTPDCAPTRGYAVGEDLVFANPLKPNYIIISPDFYGFGITEGKGQWYCFGDANGQSSIDCLLAAKALLKQREIPQGKFLINAGYSSGGYDAIAAQKVRDMKYRNLISFDRTVVGGLPFDMEEAYSSFIRNKDATDRYFGLLMTLDSYNTHAKLGFTPEQMLKPPYDEKYDEWLHSGKYQTTDVMNEIRGVKLTDLVQDDFLDRKSEAFGKISKALEGHELKNGWEPDPTQKYSVYHLYKDFVVPVSSDRALINYLSGYRYDDQENPFRKTIIPEQSHLRTNFLFPSKDHTLLGGIGYYTGLTATLTALPILYYDDELNTHYADLIKDATPMGIVQKLDEKYNIKQLLKENMSSGSSDIFTMIATITKTVDGYMEPYDLTMTDLLQIADDSGLSLADIIQLYTYLTTEDTPDSAPANVRKASPVEESMTGDEKDLPALATFMYADYLNKWYRQRVEELELDK